jgi:hypothetical protein
MPIFLMVGAFALLWLGRDEPPDYDAMPEYP